MKQRVFLDLRISDTGEIYQKEVYDMSFAQFGKHVKFDGYRLYRLLIKIHKLEYLTSC